MITGPYQQRLWWSPSTMRPGPPCWGRSTASLRRPPTSCWMRWCWWTTTATEVRAHRETDTWQTDGQAGWQSDSQKGQRGLSRGTHKEARRQVAVTGLSDRWRGRTVEGHFGNKESQTDIWESSKAKMWIKGNLILCALSSSIILTSACSSFYSFFVSLFVPKLSVAEIRNGSVFFGSWSCIWSNACLSHCSNNG